MGKRKLKEFVGPRQAARRLKIEIDRLMLEEDSDESTLSSTSSQTSIEGQDV